MKNANYSEHSIKHLEDLEHIKKRPSMYLGEMKDPFHAIKEVLDNGVDEHLAGHVTTLYVNWDNKACEFFVADDGRGIPVGPHPKLKIPTLTAVFTRLHVGGKFTRDGEQAAYATSVGTHGVGVKATNALAESFEVWTYRDKSWWHQCFRDGFPDKKKPEKVKAPPYKEGPFKKKGTQIRVRPNKKYFDTLKIDPSLLLTRCEDIAYLCPELTIIFANGDKKPKTIHRQGGLADFVKDQFKADKKNKSIDSLHKDPIHIHGDLEKGLGALEVSLLFTTNDDEIVRSFVNVSNTPEHGAHYEGTTRALTDSILKYAKKKEMKRLDTSFLRTGLYTIVHAKLKDPKFKSQTKDKLLNKAGEEERIYEAVLPSFQKFFRKNRALAKDLIDKAIQMTEARDSYHEKKRALKSLSAKRGSIGDLPEKAAKAPYCKPEERELFIVEGDSAGGSVKSARSTYNQEVLPLRGKILNSTRSDIESISNNKELQFIAKMIGCGIKEDCKPEKARVQGKVLILADADPDGQHITSLVLSFLAEYMAPYVEAGHVYVVDAPLYVGSHKDKRFFAHSLKSMKKILKKNKLWKKAHIERLKGHGQASVEEVRQYATDPKTRRLFKVKLNGKKDFTLIRDIMGDDTTTRKKILGIDNAVNV